MSEQQVVLDPRRPRRRRTPVILLGMLPAAIAATILIAGSQYADPTFTATDASGNGKTSVTTVKETPAVVAPAAVQAGVVVPQITVTVPEVKAPAAKAVTVKAPAKKATVKKTSTVKKSTATKTVKKTTKKSTKKSTKTYQQYCSNPNPVSASGSTGKALLSAVNAERAKLGIKPLRWSSSLASTATSWSKSMLKKDLKTSKLIDGLAHNPNRPGAENVAVVYSSAGYSAGAAVKKMHKNLVRSYGHCTNLMNPKHSTMGAGIAGDGNTWYATENFR